MKKYKNFLFDLDGTLYCATDWMLYKKAYFSDEADMAHKLYGVDCQKVYEALDYAHHKVIPNIKKPNYTKQQVVYEYLASELNLTFEQVATFLEQSKSKHIKRIKKQYAKMLLYVINACRYLKSKGYRLFLVTNSYFSRKRILERLAWTKLPKETFEFINDWTQTDTVKPDVKYFDDITTKFNLDKSETLMIGNDKDQDAGCVNAGIDFYLITDNVENVDKEVDVTYEGKEQDFYNFIVNNF